MTESKAEFIAGQVRFPNYMLGDQVPCDDPARRIFLGLAADTFEWFCCKVCSGRLSR